MAPLIRHGLHIRATLFAMGAAHSPVSLANQLFYGSDNSRAMHTLVQLTTHERLIGQQVRALLHTLPIRSGVTALGIAVPHLVPRIACQLSLVPPERGTSERRSNLVAALAETQKLLHISD